MERQVGMLSQVESRLSQNEALEEARARLEARRQQLVALEKQQKEIEYATDDLLSKLKPLQQKLFGGTVKNPKELAGLEQQVEQLRSHIRQDEDKTLDLMGQVEAAQNEVTARAAEVEKLEVEWQKKREELLAEQSQLKSVIDAATSTRNRMASKIDPAHLELYEVVRQRKQGYAVAGIEQGRCQGCRITLSVSDLTRARGGELVQCDSCSRILYLG